MGRATEAQRLLNWSRSFGWKVMKVHMAITEKKIWFQWWGNVLFSWARFDPVCFAMNWAITVISPWFSFLKSCWRMEIVLIFRLWPCGVLNAKFESYWKLIFIIFSSHTRCYFCLDNFCNQSALCYKKSTTNKINERVKQYLKIPEESHISRSCLFKSSFSLKFKASARIFTHRECLIQPLT